MSHDSEEFTRNTYRAFAWPQTDMYRLEVPDAVGMHSFFRRRHRVRWMIGIGIGAGVFGTIILLAGAVGLSYYLVRYRPAKILRSIVPALGTVRTEIGPLTKPLVAANSFTSVRPANGGEFIVKVEFELTGQDHDGKLIVQYRTASTAVRTMIESAKLHLKYRADPIDVMEDLKRVINSRPDLKRRFKLQPPVPVMNNKSSLKNNTVWKMKHDPAYVLIPGI